MSAPQWNSVGAAGAPPRLHTAGGKARPAVATPLIPRSCLDSRSLRSSLRSSLAVVFGAHAATLTWPGGYLLSTGQTSGDAELGEQIGCPPPDQHSEQHQQGDRRR